ncbi:MAG: ASPIC/UnbV domain-containing protein, partial [Planctomycetales bacterium]|nr:ASPIC/UnbV domain-containing protein [Planctomycetales bacterium]
MSRSPTETSSSAEVLEYDKGWAALNRLIRSGRSFSGRERNCCFLNTGAQRFANVSAVTGLDFPDDGRGLCVTDWDHDGRLDFWATNRTGPRIRFLKNNYQTDNEFISFSLVGTSSNRDAIGARVMLTLAGNDQPLIRSLYAGSGYLSQSTKWLHVGLGKGNAIDAVKVHWPGGAVEEFAIMPANGHYILQEGTGKAKRWEPPTIKQLTPSAATEPDLSPLSRVVVLHPAPIPQSLTCLDLDGNPTTLAAHRSGPILINLWSTTCTNCLHELSEWTERSADFEAAGLQVLAVNVDPPGDDPVVDRDRIENMANRIGMPFSIAIGNQALVETLNVFQRTFVGRQSDLPLPSSL